MTDTSPDATTPELPKATIERASRRWTWVWLVTLAAVVVAGVLAYQSREARGIPVTITFENAYALTPGDPVIFRGLQVGEVKSITLGEGLDGVAVEVSVRPDARDVSVEGSRWWIVRPEIGLRGISGLETLVGPRYIEVEPGPADAPRASRFVGDERTPDGEDARPGSLKLELIASRRGSLQVGSPVHYRDIRVGAVQSFQLTEDATGVRIGVVIDAEHAHLVRSRSRFWNASGIGVDWGIFAGLSVRTESLETVIGGGIGFATPDRPGDIVQDGHQFDLADEVDPAWLKWSPVLTAADDD